MNRNKVIRGSVSKDNRLMLDAFHSECEAYHTKSKSSFRKKARAHFFHKPYTVLKLGG